ncbi:MAG: hypothetical protein AMJ54_08465 [Deltaproteobacteria bacterium SG8_13]|nr:MAG: hypothetical protein AMJ54_08465 [Deltaproteobacteria bacterium SG8_13]
MSRAETEKIRTITDEYRQYKIKFIQFCKLCELVISQQRLQEIRVQHADEAVMELIVMDTSILVRFGVLFKADNTPLGRIDFLNHHANESEPIYSLFFNQVGNILESVSDSFSNRQIHDEHDIPYVLHRFLQQFLRTLRLPETVKDKKE